MVFVSPAVLAKLINFDDYSKKASLKVHMHEIFIVCF
jgi:hypothetical protein